MYENEVEIENEESGEMKGDEDMFGEGSCSYSATKSSCGSKVGG